MDPEKLEDLLKTRYECEDILKKYQEAKDKSVFSELIIKSTKKRLEDINKELMKRAM